VNDTGRPALEASRLSKTYGRNEALRDVDLRIDRGTTTALVGPNGAGKSTIIKTWVGFEWPTAGRVAVLGFDPRRDRARALNHIGYVPQATALYRELTVEDHLRLAVTLRPGFDRSHAADQLRRLEIPLGAQTSGLSVGQQLQVVLALALGTRAEILLLDEPLASLDPLARREFLAVVGDVVRARGATVLLSSHVITDIQQACQRLIVLGHGRVLLHAGIGEAIRQHWLAEADVPLDGHESMRPIGDFPGPTNETFRLWRREDGAPAVPDDRRLRPATLEELVMGYLASGRALTH